MTGTKRTRSAEARLTTAAPKVAKALDELREELDSPFGPTSIAGNTKESVRGARDSLYAAATALRNALEMLHEVNEDVEDEANDLAHELGNVPLADLLDDEDDRRWMIH